MNNHISHSQLDTFLRCELKWKLGRELLVLTGRDENSGTWAQKAGSVIHTIMEMYHHPDNNPREVGDLETFLAHALEEIPLKSPYLGQVKKTITNFVNTFGKDSDHAPDQCELEFDVPLIPGCDLRVVFDDVTFNHETKELVIGEYKSSLKEIDVEEKVWMTYQPFVYQYAAGIKWPDYILTGIQYTLLSPKSVERVIRPMWDSDRKKWAILIPDRAAQMMLIKNYGVIPFSEYGFNCKWCEHWRGTCLKKFIDG